MGLIIEFVRFVAWKVKDVYTYFKNKEWEIFDGFGLHIYVGMFGSGKTSSMVYDAYCLASKYKSLQILTNMHIQNFPKHTKIIPLVSYKQIVDSPANTLILMDELSSEANSRDWKKEGIPPDVLRTILQCRKQRKEFFATAQRFMHVDALYRQITFTVRECHCMAGRWNFVSVFDGWEYENRNNPLKPLESLKSYSFVQTDHVRSLYDTAELVEKLKKTEYVDSVEILEKQGTRSTVIAVSQSEETTKKSIYSRIIGNKQTAKQA
jgi:hypothetical protein